MTYVCSFGLCHFVPSNLGILTGFSTCQNRSIFLNCIVSTVSFYSSADFPPAPSAVKSPKTSPRVSEKLFVKPLVFCKLALALYYYRQFVPAGGIAVGTSFEFNLPRLIDSLNCSLNLRPDNT
jgi:hypothetical protein